jgi:hypothetical protein
MQTQTTALDALLARLREVSEAPPRKLFNDVLEHGQEAIAPLIAIVNEYPGDDPDADQSEYWTTYHAIRLLGELHAADAVGPLIALLDEDDDYIDMYLADSLAQIGEPAVEPLKVALFAPNADVFGVARASRALKLMAESQPERRSEVVSVLTERLDADIPNDDPYALRAFLISDLADLRAVEAIPSAHRAFEGNLVDEMVIDLESFDLLANRPDGMSPTEAYRLSAANAVATSTSSELTPGSPPAPDEPAPTRRPIQPFGRKVGRNEACPCGSNQKYKRCHGR